MRKYIFAQESFYLQGILNDINEQDTSFLDCKHKHMMKCGDPCRQIRSPCTVCLPIVFHGFTSIINSKGYHSLVPVLISIFLETVWVPLWFCHNDYLKHLFYTESETKALRIRQILATTECRLSKRHQTWLVRPNEFKCKLVKL